MSFGKEAVSFGFGLDAKSVRLEVAETLLSHPGQVPHQTDAIMGFHSIALIR